MAMKRLVTTVLLALFCQKVVADKSPLTTDKAYDSGALGTRPSQSFQTVNWTAPLFFQDQPSADDDDSEYLFITPVQAGNSGPFIYNAKTLSLVYADLSFRRVGSATIQEYKGDDYLTFFSLDIPATWTHCRLYDTSYRLKYTVHAVNLKDTGDLHECQLTSDGTALIILHVDIPWDTTSVGGSKNGMIADSVVQEIDIVTGDLKFQWRASDHIDITDSYADRPTEGDPFDPYHMNSLQKTSDGNILISCRHLFEIRSIDGKTGKTLWQLGGKKNEFKDLSGGKALDFSWQHHARLDDSMTQLSMFNNHQDEYGDPGTCKSTDNCSGGLVLSIDTDAKTATFVQSYLHPKALSAGAEGSMQILPNGNAFVGYGIWPSTSEHRSEGTVVQELEFGEITSDDAQSYRAFKMNWTATPTWGPAVAGSDGKFWVSWNGATELRTWAVLGSNSPTRINGPEKVVKAVLKNGFETEINISGRRYVRAAALDRHGNILSSSDVVDLKTGKTHSDIEVTDVGNVTPHPPKSSSKAAPPTHAGSIDSGAANEPSPSKPTAPTETSNEDHPGRGSRLSANLSFLTGIVAILGLTLQFA